MLGAGGDYSAVKSDTRDVQLQVQVEGSSVRRTSLQNEWALTVAP